MELASRASRPRDAVGVPTGMGMSKRRKICSGRFTGGFVDVAERLLGGRGPTAPDVGALERGKDGVGGDDGVLSAGGSGSVERVYAVRTEDMAWR
jgi:hypothetical protein